MIAPSLVRYLNTSIYLHGQIHWHSYLTTLTFLGPCPDIRFYATALPGLSTCCSLFEEYIFSLCLHLTKFCDPVFSCPFFKISSCFNFSWEHFLFFLSWLRTLPCILVHYWYCNYLYTIDIVIIFLLICFL